MCDNKTDPAYDQPFGELFHTGDSISAIISAILTLINLCLLVTCVSGRCRAISVTWYIYILIAAILFYGIVVCVGLATPVLNGSSGSAIAYSISHWLQLQYSSYVLWINQEVLRTVICPKLSWPRTKRKRLYQLICLTIVISLIVVIVNGALTYQDLCWNSELVIYILKDCVLGFSVIVVGIFNTVCYVRLRYRGLETYHHTYEGSTLKLHPTEWFVCVTLINSIFVIFEVMFTHFSMVVDFSSELNLVAVRLFERVSLLLLGLPILALSMVRSTIKLFFRRIVCRQGGDDAEEGKDMDMKVVESGDKMIPLVALEGDNEGERPS